MQMWALSFKPCHVVVSGSFRPCYVTLWGCCIGCINTYCMFNAQVRRSAVNSEDNLLRFTWTWLENGIWTWVLPHVLIIHAAGQIYIFKLGPFQRIHSCLMFSLHRSCLGSDECSGHLTEPCFPFMHMSTKYSHAWTRLHTGGRMLIRMHICIIYQIVFALNLNVKMIFIYLFFHLEWNVGCLFACFYVCVCVCFCRRVCWTLTIMWL